MSPEALVCHACGASYAREGGVWGLLAPERVGYFARFTHEYETVRQAEGRGSSDPAFYRALPFTDRSGRFSADWRIRATSYKALIERVVAPLEARADRSLTMLDLGAGNCWLSNQLAARGHTVAAVDLLTNAADGLGAHVHYETAFTPVQAEFDRLPLADAQADLVIFNASLHYAPDYAVTLTEALRVLRADGRLVILDSPIYSDPTSGAEMVREREAYFLQRHGFRSDAIASEHFLTHRRLDELATALGIRWQTIAPYYGLAWAMRPWKARLRRSREPARFLLIIGSR